MVLRHAILFFHQHFDVQFNDIFGGIGDSLPFTTCFPENNDFRWNSAVNADDSMRKINAQNTSSHCAFLT